MTDIKQDDVELNDTDDHSSNHDFDVSKFKQYVNDVYNTENVISNRMTLKEASQTGFVWEIDGKTSAECDKKDLSKKNKAAILLFSVLTDWKNHVSDLRLDFGKDCDFFKLFYKGKLSYARHAYISYCLDVIVYIISEFTKKFGESTPDKMYTDPFVITVTGSKNIDYQFGYIAFELINRVHRTHDFYKKNYDNGVVSLEKNYNDLTEIVEKLRLYEVELKHRYTIIGVLIRNKDYFLNDDERRNIEMQEQKKKEEELRQQEKVEKRGNKRNTNKF